MSLKNLFKKYSQKNNQDYLYIDTEKFIDDFYEETKEENFSFDLNIDNIDDIYVTVYLPKSGYNLIINQDFNPEIFQDDEEELFMDSFKELEKEAKEALEKFNI